MGMLRLGDGRTVAFEEYGDPAGLPIVYCHGAFCSRRDMEAVAGEATRVGVRVIAANRPGIGGSTRRPGRTAMDCASDVEAVVDHLGVERFAVLGWSLGGPHAMGCAVRLRDRVLATGLVACVMPPDDAWWGRLDVLDRALTWTSLRVPFLAGLDFRLARWLARWPRLFLQVMRALVLHECDARLLAQDLDGFGRRLREATADPRGVADDYRAMGRPWGFAPEDVRGPVHMWQGDQDGFFDGQWGKVLAARIPGAEMTWCPGEGHFLWMRRAGEIFETLKGASRG